MLIVLTGSSPTSSLNQSTEVITDEVGGLSEKVSLLTGKAQEVVGLFSSFDWTNPGWDFFVVLLFAIGAFLYGFSLGRDRVLLLLLSTYMAFAVLSSIPFFDDGSDRGYIAEIGIFFGIFAILFFILSRMGLMRRLSQRVLHGSWLQTFVFSSLNVGLILSIVLSILPSEMLSQFSDGTIQIFTGEISQFLWISAPLVAMIFLSYED